MRFFGWFRKINTEAEGEGDASELFLRRDAKGNWVDDATGEIVELANEPEDDDDADA